MARRTNLTAVVLRNIALLVAMLLMPVTALADISGKPRIIDGDTLEITGQRIRLHGIDAPGTTTSGGVADKHHSCSEPRSGSNQ
jgi:endonuclease YncB( thermonuclease family)